MAAQRLAVFNIHQNGEGKPYYDVDVPGDGSCMFYAVALSYLLPVLNNDKEFIRRFELLFGNESADKPGAEVTKLLEELRAYDGSVNAICHSRMYDLILNFRERVVNSLKSDNDWLPYLGVETDTQRERYFEQMKTRGVQGGQPELAVISKMLKHRIRIFKHNKSKLGLEEMSEQSDMGKDYHQEFYLIHSGDSGRSEAGHYHYLTPIETFDHLPKENQPIAHTPNQPVEEPEEQILDQLPELGVDQLIDSTEEEPETSSQVFTGGVMGFAAVCIALLFGALVILSGGTLGGVFAGILAWMLQSLTMAGTVTVGIGVLSATTLIGAGVGSILDDQNEKTNTAHMLENMGAKLNSKPPTTPKNLPPRNANAPVALASITEMPSVNPVIPVAGVSDPELKPKSAQPATVSDVLPPSLSPRATRQQHIADWLNGLNSQKHTNEVKSRGRSLSVG